MRILKVDDYRRMPWRNGRGETAEVAIGPTGATLDDFDWRVSMARIESDGPFSIFPDTDRTLAVLRGGGLQLSITGSELVELTCDSDPLAFRGDLAADATLIRGSVTDLNVMTHRTRSDHFVRRLRVEESVELAVNASVALLVCAHAAVRVEVNSQTACLATLDTLLLEEAPVTLRLSGDSPAVVYLIEIRESRRCQS